MAVGRLAASTLIVLNGTVVIKMTYLEESRCERESERVEERKGKERKGEEREREGERKM